MQEEESNKDAKRLIENIKLIYRQLARDLGVAKKEHRDRINALINRIKERRIKEIQDKLKSL